MFHQSRAVVRPKTDVASLSSLVGPAPTWEEEFARLSREAGEALSKRGREVSADPPAWCLGPSRPRRRAERDDPDTGPDR